MKNRLKVFTVLSLALLTLASPFSWQGIAYAPQTAQAAGNVYYIATNGNDANPGTSAAPWKTFAYAFTRMSGGDTLIIKDGTYTNQQIGGYDVIPAGTPSAYTTIKAENNFKVVVDATNLSDIWSNALNIENTSYVQVEGIKFKISPSRLYGGPGAILDSHHIKIFRCAFYDAAGTGNNTALSVSNSSYVLLEECYAWGTGRYKFLWIASDKVILRRCVARHDKHTAYADASPHSTFSSYRSTNTILENNIAIDSDQKQYYVGGDFWGAYYFPNGNSAGARILGSISLKTIGKVVHREVATGAHEIKDSVFWDSPSGIAVDGSGTLSINHSTIGNIWGTSNLESADGVGAWTYGVAGTINNSLVRNCRNIGIAEQFTSNYNNFYGNGQNYGAIWWGKSAPTPGAHDMYVDPQQKYITRVESNSPLKGAASDGGDIGANVIYRYGVSGTLYGEPGYDQLTNVPLWPFPNEDEIKKDMASFVGPPSGKRGFAADGTGLYGGPITLTSYIWEYLGNPCPSDICTGGSTPAPTCSSFTYSAWGTCQSNGTQTRTITSQSPAGCTGGNPILTQSCTYVPPANTCTSFTYSAWSTCQSNNTQTRTVLTQSPTGCTGGSPVLTQSCTYVPPISTNCSAVNVRCVDDTPGSNQEYSTIQAAANVANPGDTVLVFDGTYAGFMMQRSGTQSAPITFKANGSNVIVNSRNANTTDNINIESWDYPTPASYIIVDGFKVQNAPRNGIRATGGTGIVLQSNTISNSQWSGILTGWTPGVQIINNTVTGSVGDHGIYVSNSNVANDNPVIRGNQVYNNLMSGIQLNGDHNAGGDGVITGAVVENNIVHDNRYKGFSIVSTQNSTFRNNVVYNNGLSGGAGGIHLSEEPGTGIHSSNNLIVNNTIIETRIAGIRISSGSTNNVVFNNIVVGGETITFEGSGNYQSSNTTQSSTSGLFQNANSNDYRLISTSPARNSGVASYRSKPAPIVDILGTTRPQGTAYDKGAYEYIESGTQPSTCTSFTYSAWGTCQSNNTQTRTVLTQSPLGCTGGNPIVTQSCNYIDPALLQQINNDIASTSAQIASLQAQIVALQSQLSQAQAHLTDLQSQLAQLVGGSSFPLGEVLGTTTTVGIAGIPADFTFENNLKIGNRGIEVNYLQLFLQAQGPDIYPISYTTNYFGQITKQAVIKFQEKYAQEILYSIGLTKATGVVGPSTRAKINSMLGH